jgi:hypothetical protein
MAGTGHLRSTLVADEVAGLSPVAHWPATNHYIKRSKRAVLETLAEGLMPAVQETVERVRRIDVD